MSLQNLYNTSYRLLTLAITALIPVMAQAQKSHFEKAFDTTHLLTYLIAGMFIAILVLLFYNRLYAFSDYGFTIQTRGITGSLRKMETTPENTTLWSLPVSFIMMTSRICVPPSLTFVKGEG